MLPVLIPTRIDSLLQSLVGNMLNSLFVCSFSTSKSLVYTEMETRLLFFGLFDLYSFLLNESCKAAPLESQDLKIDIVCLL